MKLLAMVGRNRLALALLLFAGVTCRESTAPRYQSAPIGIAPVLTERASAIYSNLVVGGLLVDNVHIVLKHADGSIAIDTVISVAADQDSVVLEMTVAIVGTQETLTAEVELRDGTLVLFGGEISINAVAGSAATTPTVEIPLEFEGPGANVGSIDIQPADTAIKSADSVVYRPSAKDSNQAVVTDFALNWSVKNPLLGTVSATGVFKPLSIRGETYVIASTYTDIIDSARVVVTPPATQLVVISGNNQTGTVGGLLPQDLVIESRAADNLPVPGVTVNLTGPPGTVVIQITNQTDANGRISFSVPVGTIAGPIAFSVASPGLPGLNLTGTAVAAAPAKLAVSQQPSAVAASGAVLATQPKVQLQDTHGNSALVAGKAVVASLTTPAGRTVSGTTTVNTDANGVATFTNLAVSGPTGAFTLRFTSDTLTFATSNTITLGVGAAAKVVLTTRPSTTEASGVVLGTQPIARISDAAGNTVTSSSASVTVTASAGYTVGGSATVTAGSGIVTYTGISVSGPAGNALLTFASTGLASDTATVAVSASAGAPASIAGMSPLAFADSVEGFVVAGNLATVVVKDAQNVVVPGVAVQFTLFGGFGSLIDGVGGPISVTTGVDGVAKLTSQRLRDSIGVDSVFVTTAGVPDTVKFLIGVFNGAPHHLAVWSQPPGNIAGSAFSTTVAVLDRLNNPAIVLYGPAPSITIAIKGGTGTVGAVLSPDTTALTQPTLVGFATFGVSIDLVGTNYQLTVASAGLTTIETDPFDISAAGPGVTWIDPAGGNWSDPGNWSTGVVPTSTDVVGISLDGTYTVTLDVNATVAGLIVGSGTGNATLSASSKTLTINGPSSTTGDGIIVLTTSTINGTGFLENVGTIYAHGASALNIGFENADQGELIVRGQASGSNAVLTVLNSFTNHGTIELTSADAGYNAQLTLSNGTLTNAADGVITSLAGAGGSRTLTAQLVNDGTLTLAVNLTLNKASANHVNNGEIDQTIANLVVTQSGTTPSFTNTGSIVLGANRSMSITDGTSDFSLGTVSGAVNSVLIVQNSPLSFSTSTILIPLQLNGTTPIVGGVVTVPSGQTLKLYGGTLGATLDVQAGGTVYTISNGTWNGTVTNNGTIKVQGQAFGSNATLTVANGFTNNGLIDLTSQDAGYSATLNVTNGTLTNASTGTINSLPGVGGSRTLAAQLDNQGLLDVDAALTMNRASSAHVNSGTIDLTTANLIISHSGTTPSFTNNGSVTLGANRTFTVQNLGALDLSGGTVSGTPTSTLVANSQTLTFTPPNVTIPMTLLSTTIVGGAVTISGDEELTLLSGGLTDPVTIESGGLLKTHGSVALTTLDMQSNAVLQVKGQLNGSHTALTVANGFTNNGLIELTSADGGYSSTLSVTSGTLTNASGATIHSIVGAGGSRFLFAQIDNQGTLDLDAPVTVSKAGAAHVNSGAIDLTVANLSVTQSGTTPSFTNTGTITLAANRDFTVSGTGTLDLSAGSVTGPVSARLVATGQALAFSTATVTIPMTLTTTTIAGGLVTIPSGQTLTLLNGGLSDPVTIANGGTLLVHGSVALTGALALPTGGTLRIRGQLIGSHTTLTVANGFANNGLIDLVSQDGGYSSTLAVTNGTLNNASGATIHSIVGDGGSRSLAAQVDNQGTLDVDAPLTVSKADADHTNSGAIDLTVANLSVTQSGTTPSFTNTGTITLAANRDFTVTGAGGSLDLANGSVTGPVDAKLIATGQTLAFTTATVTIPMTLTTTTIVGGLVTIPSGQTLTLLNGAVSDAVTIQSGGTLLTHGNVALTGALTLQSGGILWIRGQLIGSHTTLTVANGFTNNGLIRLHSADGGYSATLAVTNGTLTNATGAIIHSAAGAGGSRLLAAQLDNQGTLDVDLALTIDKAGATHVSSGSIDQTGGANLTVTQSGGGASFTNTGTVTLAASRTFSVTGGALLLGSGTVSGTVTSTLIVNNAVLVFSPNTVTIPMTLTSTSIGGGSVTIGTSQSVTLLNGGLSDPITINSGGTLLTHGSVSLAGAVTNSGNIRVRGQLNGSHAFLTVADGFTNNGLIELTSADGGYGATFGVTNGTLTNNFGGMIHSDVGQGGGRTLAAKLSNNGTLDVDYPLVLSKDDVSHYNANAIDLTNANLTVTLSGTAPAFGNGITGTITVGASRTLTIDGGTVNLIGTSVVTGDPTARLTVTNSALNFTPQRVQIPMTLTSTAISGGAVTIPSGQSVTLVSGTMPATVTVQSGGLFKAYATSAVTDLVVDAGGEVRVVGGGIGTNATLTVANGFTNNGLIKLTSENSGFTSAIGVTSGTLTNSGDANIVTEVGAGGARTIAAQLDNQGTLDLNAALTLSKANAQHTNSGNIELTSPATMTVTQTGTLPKFTNNGTITLVGRTLTVTGGEFINDGSDPSGTIQGPGTLNVSATTFTNYGNIDPGVGTLTVTGNWTQNVTNSGTNFTISGGTLGTGYGQVATTGTVTIDGSLNVSLNDFLPTLGQEFTIMTCTVACTGTFATTNLPDLTSFLLQWQVLYTTNNVKLKAVVFP